ncbi:hypothetical protein HYU23_02705 [Candidatus Woesearchaeota archaeon]|nr:hypothetical protein [Candidatus Woesearchaeota archaeon]
MKSSDISKIRREALLPAVEFREARDPPLKILKQMKIHDLLLFIGYLRQQGVVFNYLDELRNRMPNLYSRADDVVGVEKGYCLFITIGHIVKGRRLPYKKSQGSEVVYHLRQLYKEGYSLTRPVLDTELRGLYPALTSSLSRLCGDIDFSYTIKPVVKPSSTRKLKADFFISFGYGYESLELTTAILAAGIDVRTLKEEEIKHKRDLIDLVVCHLRVGKVIPEILVRELRKFFGNGNAHPYLNRFSFPSAINNQIIYYMGSVAASKLFSASNDIADMFDKKGLEDIGEVTYNRGVFTQRYDKFFYYEALINMYKILKKRITKEDSILINEDGFKKRYELHYDALMYKYGNWNGILVAFYGLENVEFPNNDKVNTTIDARLLAEELNLEEKDFYKFAKLIKLPLTSREERSNKFVHEENAKILLEKVRKRFEYYETREAT